MGRLRHTVNPAKVKAQFQALGDPSEAPAPSPRTGRRRALLALMPLLTAVLLGASFSPWDCWPLAYFALVPWVLTLAQTTHRRWSLLWATAGGAVFWTGMLYWLSWITPAGYAAAAGYLTVYWLVAAVLIRAALARRWPLTVALPLVWVSLEYARSLIITGFPWFNLAHSQYSQTSLIQIADLTGQYGVSFFVAMVNGAIVDLLRDTVLAGPPRWIPSRSGWRAAAACVAVGAALLVYGNFRMGQQTQSPGPVIGIVQEAIPISLGLKPLAEETVLQRHLDLARRFEGSRCDLVMMPETMLPTGLNPDFLARCSEEILEIRRQESRLGVSGKSQESYLLRLREWLQWRQERLDEANEVLRTAQQLGCSILGGGATCRASRQDSNELLVSNSAVWFDADGHVRGDFYSKMHLVPFSEYVPFRDSWPWLHRLLRSAVPPVMDQLEPGAACVVYDLWPWHGAPGPHASTRQAATATATTGAATLAPATAPAPGPWRLATPICYEGTFDTVCRDLVWQRGRKAADILANLSNDGWFVWHDSQGKPHGSTEQSQHLAHYCFRAVETRVPVVRSVNTGISASIDSCGRIVAELDQYGVRTMVAGALLLDGRLGGPGDVQHGPQVLVDSRDTVYSRIGNAFAVAVCLAAAGMVGGLVWRRPQRTN